MKTFRALGHEEKSDDEIELEIVKGMKEKDYQESIDMVQELTEESGDEAWQLDEYSYDEDDEGKDLLDLMNFG